MIQINDNDLPVTVAEKIITGVNKEIANYLIVYYEAHKNEIKAEGEVGHGKNES